MVVDAMVMVDKLEYITGRRRAYGPSCTYLLCQPHLHPSILPNHSIVIIRFTIILVHYIHYTYQILLILISVGCTIMMVQC